MKSSIAFYHYRGDLEEYNTAACEYKDVRNALRAPGSYTLRSGTKRRAAPWQSAFYD
jgi:hypothetical protein